MVTSNTKKRVTNIPLFHSTAQTLRERQEIISVFFRIADQLSFGNVLPDVKDSA
jgi:hypothetical protein